MRCINSAWEKMHQEKFLELEGPFPPVKGKEVSHGILSRCPAPQPSRGLCTLPVTLRPLTKTTKLFFLWCRCHGRLEGDNRSSHPPPLCQRRNCKCKTLQSSSQKQGPRCMCAGWKRRRGRDTMQACYFPSACPNTTSLHIHCTTDSYSTMP